MGFFSSNLWNRLSRFFSGLPGFSKPDKHSIHFLNISQMMGVINDNMFKFVTAFLIIEVQGIQHTSFILSLAGLVYVLPFLFFSSTAGILADRFSKQRLLIGMKIAEILIMSLAMLSFGAKSVWASYTLLFILSIHSALFGPSKYAIIAELVPKDRVSRANGLITSFTYLGIILGTFLAPFITNLTHRNFVLVAAFCLVVAIIGFAATFGIRVTPAQRSDKKINSMFISEIFKTLKFCRTQTHLLIAILGSSYFLFMGAFTQLNIIPFAISCLGMDETQGLYLFFATSLGIALGAYLGGKASRLRVELGLPCIAGFFLAAFLFALSLCSHNLILVILFLMCLGVFGGLFIVPFESFIQIFSPDEKRGQIIAANNFLSFSGVLLASLFLFFYSQILDISPAKGFGVMSVLTLMISLFLVSRLSDFALPYFSRAILKLFVKVRIEDALLLENMGNATLVLKEASWKKMFILMSLVPKAHVLIPVRGKKRFPWANWLFYSVHLVPCHNSYDPLLEAAKNSATQDVVPCLFIEGSDLPKELKPSFNLASIVRLSTYRVMTVDIHKQGRETVVAFTEH